jgi:glutamate synthase (NADPH/NADH) small chain
VNAAKTEGVRLIDHAVPVEVIREQGRVAALRIERGSNSSGMESPSSVDPRRNQASVAEAADSLKQAQDSVKKDAPRVLIEDLPADLIVVAIGQDRLAASAALFPGVEIDARGRIVVDEHGRTGNPKVFAGGDCTNGGKEVVNAVADGKLAAASILESLPQR